MLDRERKNPADREKKNFQQRKPPVKTGYTPIMNMPRLPPKIGGFAGAPGMGRPGMGPRPNMPFTGVVPPNLAPTGMGGNPMAGSMGGRPPSKQGPPTTGVVGMAMPTNLNPISQMSYASGMRPQMNPMMPGNPMMSGNPMINRSE